MTAQASPGFLLSFEGSEGCGKSTQIRLLLQHAQEGDGLCAETELLLFAASRAQIVREKIRPLLAAGAFVILDRFLDSTTVYQGFARGLPLDSVRAINAFAIGGTLPHLTLLLDMDSATARERIARSGRALDRMESQPAEFFDKVRAGYLELARAEPQRIRVLQAGQSPEAVHADIWNLVQPHALQA